MHKKSLLLILLKMAIPNIIDVQSVEDTDCRVFYKVGTETHCLECSLSDYDRVTNDPKLFVDRSLDQVYSQVV